MPTYTFRDKDGETYNVSAPNWQEAFQWAHNALLLEYGQHSVEMDANDWLDFISQTETANQHHPEATEILTGARKMKGQIEKRKASGQKGVFKFDPNEENQQ
jgi:hypothetical protein